MALLNALPATAFSFLTAPNAREYLTVLYVLYWNTRWRNPEVLHDDLHTQVNVLVRQFSYAPLRDAEFNALLQQLSDWNLIGKQVSVVLNPREWRVDWHQYWIKDDAYQIILALEDIHTRKQRRPSWTKGRDYLRTITDGLQRIIDTLERAAQPATPIADRGELRRQAYSDLLQLHDRDFADFRTFLSDLNKDLLELGRTPRIDFDRIEALIDRLQAFVNETLRFFQSRGEDVRRHATVLLDDHGFALARGHEAERAGYEESTRAPASDETHPAPTVPLRDFRQYFDWDGGLDEQSRRIQSSAFLTTQRLREYYQALTHRGLVRELLDRRIQEVAQSHEGPDQEHHVAQWLFRILPVFQVQVAPGIGTPTERGDPPRPGRRYPYLRTEITECMPDVPTDTDVSLRQRIETKAEEISDFVETRILSGRDQASFRDLHLQDLADFRILLDAVCNDPLIIGNLIAKFFRFTIHDPRLGPQDLLESTRWTGTDAAAYTAPDLIVRRKVQLAAAISTRSTETLA